MIDSMGSDLSVVNAARVSFHKESRWEKNIPARDRYELSDRGKYWQAKALYRDGDNPTALQIWKNTGIWKDFVANTKYQPFNKLLQLSCKDDARLSEIIESIKNENECFIPVTKTPKMETEQFFNHNDVGTLLPHYNFYT